LHKLFRFAALGVAALAMSAMLAACGPTPAKVALVGSDTTAGVMGVIAQRYNAKDDGSNANGDTVYNVPPVLTGSQTYTIPAGGSCTTDITYNSTSNKPPNGSSAGITALSSDTNGCLDVARSSRGRGASDSSTLDFYAYAIDGVTWSRFSNNAPANLSQAQLQGIYLCTNGGNPTITNWSQVGGANQPIVRYLPQTGSGTLSFFETRILGLSSAQQGVLDDTSCNSRPLRIEENSGNQVSGFVAADVIYPYSVANWNAQKNGVQPDIRGGAILGNINGIAPNTTTEGESCGGTCFLGRRYVYNVIKQGSPDLAASINFAGVDASHNGYLCNNVGAVIFTLTAYGFVPLPNAPAGPSLPNSTCRKNPTPL
jgi:phosphate transport system substrate-binding protein